MILIRGLVTLTLLILFLCLTVWAWSARRKPLFDAMARLPLEDQETAVKPENEPS